MKSPYAATLALVDAIVVCWFVFNERSGVGLSGT